MKIYALLSLCFLQIGSSLPQSPVYSNPVSQQSTNANPLLNGAVDSERNLSDPRAFICFDCSPQLPPITFTNCKPTFNAFRAFPSYKLRQVFVKATDEADSRPRHPKPPYYVQPPNSDCEVILAPRKRDRRAWLSFEEARDVAQSIVQECEDRESYCGGVTPIGRLDDGGPSYVWGVSVKGVTPDPMNIL